MFALPVTVLKGLILHSSDCLYLNSSQFLGIHISIQKHISHCSWKEAYSPIFPFPNKITIFFPHRQLFLLRCQWNVKLITPTIFTLFISLHCCSYCIQVTATTTLSFLGHRNLKTSKYMWTLVGSWCNFSTASSHFIFHHWSNTSLLYLYLCGTDPSSVWSFLIPFFLKQEFARTN